MFGRWKKSGASCLNMHDACNDSIPDQKQNISRRDIAIHVRPLVDLVGESDEDPKHQEEGVDVVPRSNLFVGLVVHDVGHAHQRGQRDEVVFPVGFYEVMSGNGQRVHMVLMNGLMNACGCGKRERE